MKGTLLHKLLALTVFAGYYLSAFGQIDASTNSFHPILVQQGPSKTGSPAGLRQLAVNACTDSNFWAIDSVETIEFALTPSGIVMESIVLNSDPYLSLAFCNNLNGGSYSPTFYCSLGTSIVYYDSSNLVNAPYGSGIPGSLYNTGGNGNYLYFEAASSPIQIQRYDGSSLTTVYTLSVSRQMAVADIAVDDSGNFIIVTGPTAIHSDSLLVISPTGQVLREYNFAFNCYNAYGSFLKNNVLYIGLGPGNTVHPNTLIPVTIAPDSVSAGSPLAMPSTNFFHDLASCNHSTHSTLLPPIAAFSSNGGTCLNNCTGFKNLSQNATSYQWFFPGATPSSDTAANPANICYDSAGVFSDYPHRLWAGRK